MEVEEESYSFRFGVTNIASKGQLSLTLNGQSATNFSFNGSEVQYSATLKEGTNTVKLVATNDCGIESISATIKYKPVVVIVEPVVEKPCGPRINPGNSAWQFCLVTPSGTFTRENLTNSNFSYSGRATALYFMPIAGGGDVIVNGKPYSVRSGQYYLFTGNLTVTVSTKNPGSMGHWSVCVTADRAPTYGNGNNRPASPCEDSSDKGKK
jgi:hypothetical protein